ncbi:MAG: response regulator [Pseudomonadota bacterium]
MKQILRVGDSKLLRKILVDVLTEARHKVVEAEDGQQGLARPREQRSDMVITDLTMPAMNGSTSLRPRGVTPRAVICQSSF